VIVKGSCLNGKVVIRFIMKALERDRRGVEVISFLYFTSNLNTSNKTSVVVNNDLKDLRLTKY
jgi:hypothetical protein